jgi:hypothetical protein
MPSTRGSRSGLADAVLLFACGYLILHVQRRGIGGLVAGGVVVQNVVACIFNTYLLEFAFGWIYVFGVGVLGGMMFRQRESGFPTELAVRRCRNFQIGCTSAEKRLEIKKYQATNAPGHRGAAGQPSAAQAGQSSQSGMGDWLWTAICGSECRPDF